MTSYGRHPQRIGGTWKRWKRTAHVERYPSRQQAPRSQEDLDKQRFEADPDQSTSPLTKRIPRRFSTNRRPEKNAGPKPSSTAETAARGLLPDYNPGKAIATPCTGATFGTAPGRLPTHQRATTNAAQSNRKLRTPATGRSPTRPAAQMDTPRTARFPRTSHPATACQT